MTDKVISLMVTTEEEKKEVGSKLERKQVESLVIFVAKAAI